MIYLVTHRPFEETKENVGLIINEGAYTIAMMLLPFIMVGPYIDDAANLML